MSNQLALVIETLTLKCRAYFQTIEQFHPSPETRDWAWTQCAGLNLWDSEFGSLDPWFGLAVGTRLLDKESAVREVLTLLGGIAGRLERIITAMAPEALPGSADTGALEGDEEGKIRGDINRLGRLSKLVRYGELSRILERAIRYVPRDTEGNSIADDFKEFMTSACRRLFEQNRSASGDTFEMAEVLKVRICQTVMARWKILSYNSRQADELTVEQLRSGDGMDRFPLELLGMMVHDRENELMHLIEDPAAEVMDRLSGGPTAQMPHDRLMQKDIQIDDGRNLHPPQRSSLEIPSPPKPDENHEFECPFCNSTCRADESKAESWPAHVMKDLTPYFCLAEDCPTPLEMYRTGAVWLSHMEQKHADDYWVCSDCSKASGAPVAFYAEEAAREHYATCHAGLMTDGEIRFLLKLSRRGAISFPCCLFCGFLPKQAGAEDVQREIIEHMGEMHFQHFALMSLPWLAEHEGCN